MSTETFFTVEHHNPISGTVFNEKTAELMVARGYSDPRWITQKQAEAAGGWGDAVMQGNPKFKFAKGNSGIPHPSGVRKAELSNPVVVSMTIKTEKGGTTRTFRKTYKVYNVEQCWNVLAASKGTLPNLADLL
jgi:antirestriction protein ArdC